MSHLVLDKRGCHPLSVWDSVFDLDRLFNPSSVVTQNQYPSLNVESDDTSVYVAAELPGLNKEDIKINYQDGKLSIRGQKKTDTKDDEKSSHYREIQYGEFSRVITVGEVDFEAAKATYEDGILKVDLPKSEKQKVKELPIT
ncbi:MAG: Hsp20/alpha crystallin family protein [Candidatus Margulisbacteria bacterium]|nr:Hsp20/alpha crystallin family protein [Candidatus Margulisiibacteriota bacterium]